MAPLNHGSAAFTKGTETIPFTGILFDMDGTLIDSTPAIEKFWHLIAKDLGTTPEAIMHSSHGRRTIETLALYDKSKANWDYVCKMERMIPTQFGTDAVEIPGARTLLTDLDNAGVPWAIVTSGTRGLVEGWLDVMKMAKPKVLVTAEDVEVGKPDPACYRLGAERLGLASSNAGLNTNNILVFEDSPAGIRAGVAASCTVIGLGTSHTLDRIVDAGPHHIVRDLSSISLQTAGQNKNGEWTIEIRDGLVI